MLVIPESDSLAEVPVGQGNPLQNLARLQVFKAQFGSSIKSRALV